MAAAAYCYLVIFLISVEWPRFTKGCGEKAILPRVVGGHEAIPHSWPWQAEILQQGNGGWQHKCGASLIHPEWIVTAAHCLYYAPDPRVYKIVLGEHDRNKDEQTEQFIDASQLFIHKSYMTYTGYGHDIALMRLARPAVLNQAVNLVCLPEQDQRVKIGKMCYLTGWGAKKFNGSKAIKLQQATMPTVDYATCSEGNSHFQPIDDSSMLCAGFGGSSSVSGCNGDSGGPFVCEEEGKFVLRGAVSWGMPKCNAGTTFSVFARISSFVKWIEDQIQNSDSV